MRLPRFVRNDMCNFKFQNLALFLGLKVRLDKYSKKCRVRTYSVVLATVRSVRTSKNEHQIIEDLLSFKNFVNLILRKFKLQ